MTTAKKSKAVKTATVAKAVKTAAPVKAKSTLQPRAAKKAAPVAKTAKPAAKTVAAPAKTAAADTGRKSVQGRGIFKPAALTAELIKRREAKKLTPRQLSTKLGMSPSTVGQIESKGSDMRVGSLIAICRELGVKASRLLATLGE